MTRTDSMPVLARRHTARLLAGAAVGAFVGPVRAADRPLVVIVRMLPPGTDFVPILVARLQSLGWIDGRTADVVVKAADRAGLPVLVAEVAAMRPTVVVSSNEWVLRAVQRGIPNVPIVMIGSNDPVGLGWVESLRRPGGRITGTAWTQDPEIGAKNVELATDLVPGLRRIGCIIDPLYPGIDRYRAPFEAAARRAGAEMQWADVSSPEQIERAFAALGAFRAQAVVVYGSAISYVHVQRFASAALAARQPTIHIFRHAAEAGGLMSYGPSWPNFMRRTGDYVDRILRGANPAELPVEQPSVYELIVNLRTANALGLKVPPAMLARADEVIE